MEEIPLNQMIILESKNWTNSSLRTLGNSMKTKKSPESNLIQNTPSQDYKRQRNKKG